jgi:serine/threonine protein phosphatase PrpC
MGINLYLKYKGKIMKADINKNKKKSAWTPLYSEVAGYKHIRQGVECQDACFASNTPRPFLIACDGRGSASLSHLGARAAVQSVKRQIRVSEILLKDILDNGYDSDAGLEKLNDIFYKCAAVIQNELAEEKEMSHKEFEFTLILLILGKKKSFYLHVGDGALVIEKESGPQVLSAPQNGKYANVTSFVQYGKYSKMRSGFIDTDSFSAAAAFSDGTGEKMLEARTNRPTPGFSVIWTKIRQNTFGRSELLEFLTSNEWDKVQDDRCLAILTRDRKIEKNTFLSNEEVRTKISEAEEEDILSKEENQTKMYRESVIVDNSGKKLSEELDAESDCCKEPHLLSEYLRKNKWQIAAIAELGIILELLWWIVSGK